MSDLDASARLIGDAVADLDGLADAPITDLERTFILLDLLDKSSKVLTDVRHRIGHQLGLALGDGEWHTIDGKQVRRRPYISRSKWDHEALEHAVLDSTLVDPKTGEITPETEAEKRKAVWGAKGYAASVTALRARGIQPDEFCTERFRYWALEIR